MLLGEWISGQTRLPTTSPTPPCSLVEIATSARRGVGGRVCWGRRGYLGEERTLDSLWNGYSLCILGDLKGEIGSKTRSGICGAFGVPGGNDNGRREVEFRAERGLCVWVTHILSTEVFISGKGYSRSED